MLSRDVVFNEKETIKSTAVYENKTLINREDEEIKLNLKGKGDLNEEKFEQMEAVLRTEGGKWITVWKVKWGWYHYWWLDTEPF